MSYKAIGKLQLSSFLISFLLHFIMIWARKCLVRDHGSSFPWHFMSLGIQNTFKILIQAAFQNVILYFFYTLGRYHICDPVQTRRILYLGLRCRGFWWHSCLRNRGGEGLQDSAPPPSRPQTTSPTDLQRNYVHVQSQILGHWPRSEKLPLFFTWALFLLVKSKSAGADKELLPVQWDTAQPCCARIPYNCIPWRQARAFSLWNNIFLRAWCHIFYISSWGLEGTSGASYLLSCDRRTSCRFWPPTPCP